MTAKDKPAPPDLTVWMADPEDGTKALVPAADVEKLEGWLPAGPPMAGDWVWLRHEIHGGVWRCNATAAPMWAVRGWFPSTPPALSGE